MAASADAVAWSPSVPSFDSASSRWRSASQSRLATVAIPLVGRGGHRLGLLNEVGGVVEDAVDPAREREQVLGLDGGDERLPERAQQVALGDVATVLGSAHGLGRRRVAARPALERVCAVDRDRASWSPFVTANPIASSTATTSWASMGGLYGRPSRHVSGRSALQAAAN